MNDVTLACRTLLRSRWYSLTVIAVLAIGIALTTVAFAVVDGVLFKPLPYPRASELHLVRADGVGGPHTYPPPVSGREAAAWQRAAADAMLTVVRMAPNGGEISIDENFFNVLGRQPLAGGFTAADFDWFAESERSGRRIRPVLIAHRLWLTEYGGDPSVVGRTILTANRPGFVAGRRIAGILPPDFVFPVDLGIAQPDTLSPKRRGDELATAPEFYAIARLPQSRDAVSLAGRLTASRTFPGAPTTPDHGATDGPREAVERIVLMPLTEHLARQQRPAFALVFGGASLLLLLACVNVAGLAGARNLERRRELAVRRALGATAWPLTRAVLAEVSVVALAATLLSLLLARPMLVWTVDLLPPAITLLKAPALDVRVFVLSATLALLVVAAVSVWPARVATTIGVSSSLAAFDVAATRRIRRAALPLIALQVALGFVLMTAGTLTVSSLASAWRNDTGYHRDRMVLLELYVTHSSSAQQTLDTLEAIPPLLRSLPGVDAVAISTVNPLFARRGPSWSTFAPEGWGGEVKGVASRQVSAEFFGVMGLRLVEGRWPTPAEWRDGHMAVVSRSVARVFWPDRSAVGRTLFTRGRADTDPITVVGVVDDARYVALDEEPAADVYVANPIGPGRYGVFFHVRTRGDAGTVLQSILAALPARGLRLEQAVTHDDALFASVKHRALPAWLFGSLGLGAIVVLAAGILGLLAMAVAQRTRELGIRVALGATTTRVVRLLIGEQIGAVLAGIAIGATISAWTVRLLESQLYGVRAYQPSVWAATALTLVAVAALGTLVPSLRAARIDPARTLRAE